MVRLGRARQDGVENRKGYDDDEKKNAKKLFAEQNKCTKPPLRSHSGIFPTRLFKDFLNL